MSPRCRPPSSNGGGQRFPVCCSGSVVVVVLEMGKDVKEIGVVKKA